MMSGRGQSTVRDTQGTTQDMMARIAGPTQINPAMMAGQASPFMPSQRMDPSAALAQQSARMGMTGPAQPNLPDPSLRAGMTGPAQPNLPDPSLRAGMTPPSQQRFNPFMAMAMQGAFHGRQPYQWPMRQPGPLMEQRHQPGPGERPLGSAHRPRYRGGNPFLQPMVY